MANKNLTFFQQPFPMAIISPKPPKSIDAKISITANPLNIQTDWYTSVCGQGLIRLRTIVSLYCQQGNQGSKALMI